MAGFIYSLESRGRRSRRDSERFGLLAGAAGAKKPASGSFQDVADEMRREQREMTGGRLPEPGFRRDQGGFRRDLGPYAGLPGDVMLGRAPGEPAVEPGADIVMPVVERFFEPVAAAGLSAVRAAAIHPGFERVETAPGEPPRVQKRERDVEFGVVNLAKAWAGNKAEQEKAMTVLNEAGWSGIAARVIFDPTLLLPGIGFTKVRQFKNAINAVSRLKGPARAKAITKLKTDYADVLSAVDNAVPEPAPARLAGGAAARDRGGMQFVQAMIVDRLPSRLRGILARHRIGVREVPANEWQHPADAFAVLNRGRLDVKQGIANPNRILAHEAGHIVDADMGIMRRLADESDDVIKELRLGGEPSSQPVAPWWRSQLGAGDGNNMAGEAVAEALGQWIDSPQAFARNKPGLNRIFDDLLGDAGEVTPRLAGEEVGEAAFRPTAPEGVRLTNDIPATSALDRRLAEIDTELAKPRIKNRKGLIEERATVQAQKEIDQITTGGTPVQDQLDIIQRELDELQNEARTRPIRGQRRGGTTFVPDEKDTRMGGLTAEERAAKPSAARREAVEDVLDRKLYPELSTPELTAREKVFREFVESAKFEPVEAPAPTVGRARFNERGELIEEPTFATEAELQGYKPEQGRLAEEPSQVGRDIPDPVARTVEPPPPEAKPPAPPDAPPPSIADGLTGDPQTPGGLLARFQDRLPGRTLQQSDWAKYTGGLASEGAEIEKVAMPRLLSTARKVPKTGKRLIARTRNPDNEAMLKALHGEGPVPEGAQQFYDDLQDFRVKHEQRTIGDVPKFEDSLIGGYFPRAWRNSAEKIDEYRLAQRLERGEIDPATFTREHEKIVATGGLGPGAKPGTLKHRSLPMTFSEAIEQGWEPVSWNPVDMMVLHAAELADYRYSSVLGELWKMEARAIPASSAPTSWKTPQYPAFEGRPYVTAEGKAAITEPLVVAPEDFNLLENMLGRRPTDATDVMAYVTSVFKRAKVALGLFQHVDLNYRLVVRSATRGELGFLAPGVKAMAANFAPPLRPRLMRGLLKDPQIKEMVEEGLQLTGGLDVFKREVRAAIEPDLVVRAPILGDLPVQRLPGGVKVAAKKVQDTLNAIYGYMGKGLFDGAQPQYMGAFAKSLRKELAAAHPGLTSRQVSALTAEQANIMMSNIPQWQSVLGPRFRQLGRGTAFSINEGEGWLRQLTRLFTAKGARGTYLRQWAGYVFGTLALAEVINYAITGELLSPEQMLPITGVGVKGEAPFVTGRPSYNSRFARPRLDGDGPVGSVLGIKGAPIKDENGNITGYRHVYLDLMGQADTPFRALDPQFFIMTRLSPQLSTGTQLLKGEKFFGEQPLEGIGEQAKFAAQQLAEPIPVSAFTQERGRIGTVGAGVQAIGWNVSGEGLGDALARTRQQVMDEKGITGSYDELKAADSPAAAQIDADSRVQAIFEEVQRSTARRAATPESEFFEKTEETRTEQQQTQLTSDARLNSGQWAGDIWREDYRERQRDFFQRREQVKADFGMEFEKKKAPSKTVNAALNAYFDVNVDAYVLPDGTTDWGAFFGAQDRALAPLSPSDRSRVMAFIHKYDTPTVTTFRNAQAVVDRFHETPKYQGLTLEQGEEVDRVVYEEAPRLQLLAQRQGQQVERGQAIAQIAQSLTDPEVVQFLMANFGPKPMGGFRRLRMAPAAMPVPTNPERDVILQENQVLLAKFYPDLLQRQLTREQEAALGEPAFAAVAR